ALEGDPPPLRLHVVSLAARAVVVDIGAENRITAGADMLRPDVSGPQLLLEPPLVRFQCGARFGVADVAHDQGTDDGVGKRGPPSVSRKQLCAYVHCVPLQLVVVGSDTRSVTGARGGARRSAERRYHRARWPSCGRSVSCSGGGARRTLSRSLCSTPIPR